MGGRGGWHPSLHHPMCAASRTSSNPASHPTTLGTTPPRQPGQDIIRIYVEQAQTE